MGALRQREQSFEFWRLRNTVHHIHWHPIPTLGIDLTPVDNKSVGQGIWISGFVWGQVNLANAKGHHASSGNIIMFFCGRQNNPHLCFIKGPLPAAVWPPQARSYHFETGFQMCMTLFQFVVHPLSCHDCSLLAQNDFQIYHCLADRVQFGADKYIRVVEVGRQPRLNKNIHDTDGAGDFQKHIVPDTQVDHARAEIPPVIHTGLNGFHATGAAHLWLLRQGRLNYDRQEILCIVEKFISYLEDNWHEHSGMSAQALAVQEKLSLIIHTLKVKVNSLTSDFFANSEA